MIPEVIPRFSLEWFQLFLAGVSTLAIYSFLYRENQFYRFFEHLFIGIATGYVIVATVNQFLWPQVLKPLFGLDRISFPDGTMSAEYNYMNLLWLLPMSFGMLYYFILSKRRKWLAQLVIGVQLGYAGGLAFQGFFVEFMPQVFDSFKPLYDPTSFKESLTNNLFLLTLFSSLSYFFFTFRPKVRREFVPGRSVLQIVGWMPVPFVVIGGISVFAWYNGVAQGPDAGDILPGLQCIFALPIVAVLWCGARSVNYAIHPAPVAGWPLSRLIGVGAILLFAWTIGVAWITAPAILDVPEVNLAFTLTLLTLLFYLALTLGRTAGGVMAASTSIGRWLMMGCFGAFFGSTIMARMALLVERLDFLIHRWLPLVF